MASLDCVKGGTGGCHRTGQPHSTSYCPTYAGSSGSDKQWVPSILLFIKFLLLLDLSLSQKKSQVVKRL